MRGLELIIRGNNRSAIRALKEVADQSHKTGNQVKRDTDRASAGFRQMGEHAERLRGVIGGLAGTVGLGGLAFGIKDVVSAGVDWQKQQTQLQGALRATGQYSKETVTRLNEVADRLSKRGGFGGAENVHALTLFVTATKSTTKAQRDLTLSTDIARRTGKDYSSIVRAIQMLEQGRTTGLSRLGIAIPKVTTAEDKLKNARLGHKDALLRLEAAGVKLTASERAQLALQNQIAPAATAAAKAQDQLAASRLAFGSLQRLYGGATAGFSNTTQGRLSNLANTAKELQEKLGSGLLPTVNDLAKIALRVVDGFGHLPTPLKLAIVGFSVLAPLLMFARTAMSLFTGTLRGLGKFILHPFQTLKGVLLGTADEERKSGTGTAGALVKVAEAADLAAAALARVGELGLLGGGAGAAAAAEGKGGGLLAKLLTKVPGGSKLLGLGEKVGLGGILKGAGKIVAKFGIPATIGATLINHIPGVSGFVKGIPGVGGLLHGASSFLGFASGGVVPRYMAGGGPMGTDTIPAWLTPGEGVVNTRGMATLGAGGLSALNSGAWGGGREQIVLAPIVVNLDGRVLTKSVVRQVLNKAARGPTSLVGGSLVTGAPGLPN